MILGEREGTQPKREGEREMRRRRRVGALDRFKEREIGSETGRHAGLKVL